MGHGSCYAPHFIVVNGEWKWYNQVYKIRILGEDVIWSVQNKEAKWFSYASLSLTALTLCAFYSDGADRAVNEECIGKK